MNYDSFCEILQSIRKICGIYFAWIALHYAATHLYVYACTPGTLYGFAIAAFLAPTPHCQALRWLIYTGGNNIGAMWILLGAWCMKYLSII